MHILFDLDRTLWDFDGNAAITFRMMFDQFHLDRFCADYDQFHSVYQQINSALWQAYRDGMTTKEVVHTKRFSQTLEHFHVPDIEAARLAPILADYYIYENSNRTGLMPGTMPLLEQLANSGSHTLSIISNGFREAQIPKMRTSGLTPYFSHVFLSEDLGCQKPATQFFTSVLNRLHAEPSDCLVVGDDYEADILGAHRAGIAAVHYNPHRPSQPPTLIGQSPTIHLITHLTDLLEII